MILRHLVVGLILLFYEGTSLKDSNVSSEIKR